MTAPLLSLKGVGKTYAARGATPAFRALAGIDLTVMPGEALGIVGESGSGKTTLGRIVTAAMPPSEGEVLYRGTPYRAPMPLPRRAQVQAVLQDTLGALNPRLSIRRQIHEPFAIHRNVPRAARGERILEALAEVGLDESVLARFPGGVSGGQRQRLLIARALLLDPELLVADEPVSALDVSVQAQVMTLLDRLRRERGMAMIFISHDLRVVRQLCDRVAVMNNGAIVEIGPTAEVLEHPTHDYTRALMAALPRDHPRARPTLSPESTTMAQPFRPQRLRSPA